MTLKNIKFFKDKDTDKYVELNELSRKLHTLALGLIGSGKNSQIIIPMMHEDVKNNESVIVLEPKEMLSEKLYAMAKYYNKEHVYIDFAAKKVDYYYNIFDEDILMINYLFSNILKDMNKEIKDSHLLSLNEKVLLEGVKIVKENIVNPDLRDLNKLLTDKKFLKSLIYLNKEKDENYFKLLIDYHEKDSILYKEAKIIRKLICNLVKNEFLNPFLLPSKEKEKLDFDKIINSNTLFAINTSRGVLRELGVFIDKLFIYKIQDTLYSKPVNSDIINYFYIDEPQIYMNKDFNTSVFTKKGVSLTLSVQTLIMFEDEYRDVLKTNIENIIILPSLNKLDADFFSKRMNSSPEGLIYRPFGEVNYLFKTKKGDEIGVAKVEYLEKGLNDSLNKIIDDFYSDFKNR